MSAAVVRHLQLRFHHLQAAELLAALAGASSPS